MRALSMAQPSLAELQAWFLTAVTAPGGAVQAHQQYGWNEDDILRRPASGVSRLHIYADGYVARLLDCLRADYPVLRRLMGVHLFDFFARAYLERHPSRSSTLYDLGHAFPDFLDSTLPAATRAGSAAQFAFPVQLARLERARSEAALAPGLETAGPPAAACDLLGHPLTMLRLAPCTRLLALSHPAAAFWESTAALAPDAALPPPPEPGVTFVAVARARYRVQMHMLAAWQFHYLQAAAAGASGAQCAMHAAQAAQLPRGRVLADAFVWVPQALAGALLSAD